jgi:hypothetical protein
MMKKSIIISTVLVLFVGISTLSFASDVSSLIKDLNKKDKAKEASEKLAKIGKPAVPALIKALTGKKKYQKRYAARAIREMGQAGSDAIPALEKLLKDRDSQTREYAVEALGNMVQQADQVILILKNARKDSNKDIRKKAEGRIEKLIALKAQDNTLGEQTIGRSPEESPSKDDRDYPNERDVGINGAGLSKYIIPSDALMPGCIDIQKGVYNMPFNTTPVQVMEWAKKENLDIAMKSEVEDQSAVSGFIHELDELQDEGFFLLDPNSRELVIADKFTTRKGLLALEQRLSELTFAQTYRGRQRYAKALKIRDYLNTLKNPYIEHENEKYFLKSVFSFIGGGMPLYLDKNYECFDDKIIRNTCFLKLMRKRTLNDSNPLVAVTVYFARIGEEQWNSFATSAFFASSEINEIIEVLNKKYGQFKVADPYYKSLKMPPDQVPVRQCISEVGETQKYWYYPNSLTLIFFHLYGVWPTTDRNSILVWKNNIFALNLPATFSMVPVFVYFDSKYAQTIIDSHIFAIKERKKQLLMLEKKDKKQMMNKF